MSSKITLPAAGIALLILNFVVIYRFNLDYSRGSRLFSTVMVFLLLILKGSEYKRILISFSLFVLADILLFYYENDLFNALTFLTRTSAYILLILVVVPELKGLKANLFQKSLFVVVFCLNFGMLVLLVDMVPSTFHYDTMEFLFYLYGLAMMGMVIAAISYSNRFSSRKSFYFASATLCLVFSDITSFIAYYLDFHLFYFADRFFYILAILGLLKFASLSENHQAVAGLERL